MNDAEYRWLQDILYEEDIDVVKKEIERMNNSILLHIFAGNYNWNNGFDIPNIIINNDICDLGTALLLFYSADGYRMLEDEQGVISSNSTKWKEFLIDLYDKITNNKFNQQNIAFNPPLTKIQILKLKKKRSDIPSILLEVLNGNEVKIPKL
ncbi:DUF4274 domain-containing protein [Anaerosinus massiliensis]|uniref:DUF4274 domain-containing protein n=1 Tax=Massilibacillus massiliensis TaxID=1806837 RepID=UPI000DA61989|nr:DUF4274 domain-containing protein [Massilibacillus massiliensis]